MFKCDNCGLSDTYVKNYKHEYNIKGEKVIFESENIKYKPRLIVTSKEIYTEAFNKNINFSLDARSNSEIRKIGLVMNNHPGWKKQTIRLPDRKGIADKGFKRL